MHEKKDVVAPGEERDTALGGLIRQLREQRQLSVKKLASLAGVSRKTIDNVEQGQNISVLVLKRLLRPLGVDAITLRVRGAHEVHVAEGLAPADVRAVSDAINQARLLLQSVAGRIAHSAVASAPAPAADRAERLIASFSDFVRSVDDPDALEQLQESMTSLYEVQRRSTRRRVASRQRRTR